VDKKTKNKFNSKEQLKEKRNLLNHFQPIAFQNIQIFQ
jgi:hypothetical protein